MKGFDAEFRDLDHYIRTITDRIWEGGRVDDIHRYYSADCAVETPSGVSIGAAAVVAGTRSTLAEFPDRRLLAEDVVIPGALILRESVRGAAPPAVTGAATDPGRLT